VNVAEEKKEQQYNRPKADVLLDEIVAATRLKPPKRPIRYEAGLQAFIDEMLKPERKCG